MTKTEYYQKIENQLLKAMDTIDAAVGIMNQLYHENYKAANQILGAKKILKQVLNKKFDSCARKRQFSKKVSKN